MPDGSGGSFGIVDGITIVEGIAENPGGIGMRIPVAPSVLAPASAIPPSVFGAIRAVGAPEADASGSSVGALAVSVAATEADGALALTDGAASASPPRSFSRTEQPPTNEAATGPEDASRKIAAIRRNFIGGELYTRGARSAKKPGNRACGQPSGRGGRRSSQTGAANGRNGPK